MVLFSEPADDRGASCLVGRLATVRPITVPSVGIGNIAAYGQFRAVIAPRHAIRACGCRGIDERCIAEYFTRAQQDIASRRF